MKTKTIELYEYDELSELAQKRARAWYREGNDFPGLSEEMTEYAKSLIEEAGISFDNMRVFYSLTCCQGDGAMIEGGFIWNGHSVNVKQSGHYYHFNSKTFTIYDSEGIEVNSSKLDDEFNDLYVSICKKLEKYGYDVIDLENDDENIADNIRANEYTFTKDGKREEL